MTFWAIVSTMLCELSECQLAVDTSPLTEPVNCVIEDTCTGVRCCAEVGFLQRSFEVHLSLDPCTQTIQVSIERLNFNVSLSTITMGKGDNSTIENQFIVTWALSFYCIIFMYLILISRGHKWTIYEWDCSNHVSILTLELLKFWYYACNIYCGWYFWLLAVTIYLKKCCKLKHINEHITTGK